MRRADLAERIDSVEQRMDSIEQRLDASYTSLSTQILQSRRENDDAHSAMRTEFSLSMSALRSEFLVMRTDVAGEFSAMRAEVAGQFSATQAVTLSRFEKLETALADGLDETRRFMRVLHEDVLSRIALLGEGRPSSS
jgi:hypothetical protein